jgi:hypothetical protein
MTEEIKEEVVEQQPKKEKKPKMIDQLAIGLDVGTGNFVCTRSDTDKSKILRNVFLQIDNDNIDNNLSDINYVKNDDGNIFIIGEDAFKFANLFGTTVLRPMAKGVISSKEIDAIDILAIMVKNLVGNTDGKDVYVNYSIPAESIDESRNVTYHEKVFNRILTSLGYKCSAVNEGLAVIFSEAAKDNFTAIGISWGAGMTNVCLSLKGIGAAKFSTARGGDWIDQQVSESLSIVPNRVTSVKEKFLNFETGFLTEPDKRKKRILEALTYYYESLLNYTIKKMVKEFSDNVDVDLGDSLPIILSGGTSMIPGFTELFKNIISGYKLPFEISEIRHARSPMTCVSSGLLVKCLVDIHTD